MKHRLSVGLSLLLAVVMMLSFTACGKEYRDDLTASTLGGTVKAALPVSDGYEAASAGYVSESTWGKEYKTMLDAVSDYTILLSGKKDQNVDEIGILRVADKKDVKAVKGIVEDYVKSQQSRLPGLLEMYAPNEIPKVENAKITVCGQYILYTLLDDGATKTAHDTFRTALEK